jgi:hypothetical protein
VVWQLTSECASMCIVCIMYAHGTVRIHGQNVAGCKHLKRQIQVESACAAVACREPHPSCRQPSGCQGARVIRCWWCVEPVAVELTVALLRVLYVTTVVPSYLQCIMCCRTALVPAAAPAASTKLQAVPSFISAMAMNVCAAPASYMGSHAATTVNQSIMCSAF